MNAIAAEVAPPLEVSELELASNRGVVDKIAGFLHSTVERGEEYFDRSWAYLGTVAAAACFASGLGGGLETSRAQAASYNDLPERSSISDGRIDRLASFATARVQAGNIPNVKPGISGFTTESFTIVTKPAARVSVNLGTDIKNLMPTYDNRLKINHRITVGGLSPKTRYLGTVTQTPAKGEPKTVRIAPFKTMAPGEAPATWTVSNGKILLNGKRAFPIMTSVGVCPNQESAATNAAMGINTILNGPNFCSQGNDEAQLSRDIQYLHNVLSGKLWYHTGDEVLQGLPELISWPGEVARAPILTVGSCNTPEDNRYIGQFYSAVKRRAQQKPIIFENYIATPVIPGRDNCIDGRSHSALLWTAVTANIQGIRLLTEVPWDLERGVSVNPDVEAATTEFSRRMATLGSCILGGVPVAVITDPKGPVKIGAWKYGGGAACIIAVNTLAQPTEASWAVKGLGGTTAQVLWEKNRSVKVASGGITDKFAPLGVHIYRALPPTKK